MRFTAAQPPDEGLGLAGEVLLSRSPVTVRRRVLWGECDPAGVVYSPRFSDYLMIAFGWFTRVLAEEPEIAEELAALSTPMKGLRLEFRRTLAPGDVFDLTCRVAAVRSRTFDLEIVGAAPGGEPAFVGLLSPITCVGPPMLATPIPPALRRALTRHAVIAAGALPSPFPT